MTTTPPRLSLIRSRQSAGLRAVYTVSSFGYPSYGTASLPDRLYTGLDAARRPISVIPMEPVADVEHVPTPLEALLGEEPPLPRHTVASARRLEALWVLLEDRHRLLDASEIEPLAHQASLVDHVLRTPSLKRVLIADEVGLGKTIEAGMIVKELINSSVDRVPRVLYLAPASLVDNVVEELQRLDLRPRRWSTDAQEAMLRPGDSDPLVVASIHRAVVRGDVNHYDTFLESGPWDVLIVDEAHHLSDWSPLGNDPRLRMRLVRELIDNRLTPDGRVILLTATPHQGHDARFRNLLRLLSDDGNDESDARGRIIYRIKEDIRDWDDNPLFPVRRVNEPTFVDVSDDYKAWMNSIRLLFSQDTGNRALAWRRAQALQWSASSPQAGLAYLVRFALRQGLDEAQLPELGTAIAALRPYRGGSADESLEHLRERLLKQTGGISDDADPTAVDAHALCETLEAGAQLVRVNALSEKLRHVYQAFERYPEEKFVIFAQPVETVYALKGEIESHLGSDTVSLIVGGLDRRARKQQIRAFWDPTGSRRVLVSSSSGGEGINLQIARRLIHFDVPWNPMDLEQRVGRVHRFGSAATVVVETLILEGSREQRVLDRCRSRLGMIARDLDSERFETLYTRTMSLVSYEELAQLMTGESFGPLSPEDEDRLDHLVTAGYDAWKESDDSFRRDRVELTDVRRGEAGDDDLKSILERAGARRLEGWSRRILVDDDSGEPRPQDTPADVYELAGGARGYVGRDAGVGLVDAHGASHRVSRLGLNTAQLAESVRDWVGESSDAVFGAASAIVPRDEWGTWIEDYGLVSAYLRGGVLVAYCTRELDMTSPRQREIAASLSAFLLTETGSRESEVPAALLAAIIRVIRAPRSKRTLPASLDVDALLDRETEIINRLRSSQPGEPVRAVFPIAAMWLEPGD